MIFWLLEGSDMEDPGAPGVLLELVGGPDPDGGRRHPRSWEEPVQRRVGGGLNESLILAETSTQCGPRRCVLLISSDNKSLPFF